MLTKKENVEESSEALISSLLFRYYPYWPLFLLVIILFVAGVYCYLLRVTPQYEATAALVIKDEKKGNEEDQSNTAIDLFASKKKVENELEVLKSLDLLLEVTKDLHLYAPIYETGRFRDVSAYHTSPIIVEVKDPKSIGNVKKVPFKFNAKTSRVTLSNRRDYSLNKWVSTKYGKLRFSENNYYTQKDNTKPLYFLLTPMEIQAVDLTKRLSVVLAGKMTAVIRLTIKDEVPQRAIEILNTLMSNYNRMILKNKKLLAGKTYSFVEDRLDVVAKELDSIEHRIQQFKTGNNAIDIPMQGQLVLQSVNENNQMLGEINSQLSVLNQVERFVREKEKGGSIVPSTLRITDPVLSNMLDKLYESELDYERMKRTVGEDHPMLNSVKDQVKKIRPNILENIQSQRDGLMATRAALSSANRKYNSMLRSIPQKEKKLSEISRDQSTKNNIYSFLLQKREESAISLASTVSDMSIVDHAHASLSPVSPNKKVFYGIAVIMAIFVVVAFVTAKDAFSQKLLYRQEIESYTSIPIVGEIKFNKSDKLLATNDVKCNLFSEEFRKIRRALPHIGIGPSKKKILVTSSIPGEGKSFVAANLAQTLAMMGKKVVLVDMDLYNSSLAKVMAASTQKIGVMDYLSGEANLLDIAVKTTFNERLFFISAGNPVSDPSELLSQKELGELIDYLDNTYDYVIIDSAPIVPISDANVLSTYCDATLFVVRHRYTPKVMVQHIDDNCKMNPLKNPFIVFNSVHTRGFTKNNYSYGYGYGYISYKEVIDIKSNNKENVC